MLDFFQTYKLLPISGVEKVTKENNTDHVIRIDTVLNENYQEARFTLNKQDNMCLESERGISKSDSSGFVASDLLKEEESIFESLDRIDKERLQYVIPYINSIFKHLHNLEVSLIFTC